MTYISTKKIGNNYYDYEQESYRGKDGKNHTRHIRYIGKSGGNYKSTAKKISVSNNDNKDYIVAVKTENDSQLFSFKNEKNRNDFIKEAKKENPNMQYSTTEQTSKKEKVKENDSYTVKVRDGDTNKVDTFKVKAKNEEDAYGKAQLLAKKKHPNKNYVFYQDNKKEKLYTGYIIRGNSKQKVYNLSEKESDEWISRKEKGSRYLVEPQKKRV